LLIVDVQVGLFSGPQLPYAHEQLLININNLIAKARDAGAPIFAVRHTGPAGSPIEAGSDFWQLHPALHLDLASDVVIDKTRSSSFFATSLAADLRAAQVSELVICGLKTQYCVDSACRAAAEHGFQPVLVADAHSCMDTAELAASAIIAHHNATLGGPIARLLNTADVVF
jgi:nicotinamidase-related amidase